MWLGCLPSWVSHFVGNQAVFMSEFSSVVQQPKAAASPLSGRLLQRKCACGKHTTGQHGECTECRKKRTTLQRRAVNQSGPETAPPIVHEVLRSAGRPLDPATRTSMESRFGQDFSHVRVHTDARAAESARAVNALAYTVGSALVFGADQYRPQTARGRHLLSHELVHTMQQSAVAGCPSDNLTIGPPHDSAEQEADRVADQVLAENTKVRLSHLRAAPSLQRTCGSSAIGAPAGCTPGNPTFVAGHPAFQFNINCDDFAPGPPDQAALMVATVSALPTSATIEIHGFASVDGDPVFNENLSCARALKAQAVLTGPSPAGAGIAASRITSVVRHGPTPGPAAERRSVVIQATTPIRRPTPIPSRTLPTGPFLDLQIACVTDTGGCTNPADIPRLDTQCRSQTGYTGQVLVGADLVCATPGLGIAQSLNRAYPSWLSLLPACPCTRDQAAAASNFSRDLNPFLGRFHPGADVCFRSDPVASVPGTEHRQQCCYTRGGMLLTQGGGAGTPDVWASFRRHQRIDVQPFNEFNRDFRIYNRFWVPNQGANCPASDPCLNRCEQIFENCGEGMRCLAERNTCMTQCRRTSP